MKPRAIVAMSLALIKLAFGSAAYAQTDLVVFRAEEPEALSQRQAAAFDRCPVADERLADSVASQKPRGDPGVLSSDRGHLGEHANSPGADILQIPYRRGDDVQPAHTSSSHSPTRSAISFAGPTKREAGGSTSRNVLPRMSPSTSDSLAVASAIRRSSTTERKFVQFWPNEKRLPLSILMSGQLKLTNTTFNLQSNA